MIGAILAGGRGSRIGGGKAARELAGRPMIAWPAAALAGACQRVVVVAKAATELPELPGVERWDEPEEQYHPGLGIAYALEMAGEDVLVCAADMPFVTAEACADLAEALSLFEALDDDGTWPIGAVAVCSGRLQPVFGAYSPRAVAPLRTADPNAALTATVEAAGVAAVEVDPHVVRNVNTEAELAEAERELA